MKKCMVCHIEQVDNAVYCVQCGFSMRYPKFLSPAQAQSWMQQQILPYRHQWEQKQKEKQQLKQLQQKIQMMEQSSKEMRETIRMLREEVEQKKQSEQQLKQQIQTLKQQLEQKTVQKRSLPAVDILTKESVEKTLQKNQTKYYIWDTITTIGESAFEHCDRLEHIYLSPHIRNIEQQAFRDCKKLCYINFPNSVYHIEKQAFGRCTGLQHIYIPVNSKLEYIAGDAFEEVTATVHYSKKLQGKSWVGGQYGGHLTWVAE